MEINFTKITFWTVLQYIRNTTRRFNVFVANRLTVIHTASKACHWRHVDSARNPADTASRGLMPDSECKLWLEGPSFLRQSEDHWPEKPNALAPLSDDDPEIKKVKAVATNTLLREPSLLEIMSYYSAWSRLLRAIAWLMRLKHFIVWKYGRKEGVSSPPTSYLTVKETDEALLAEAKLVQGQMFMEVLRLLEDSEKLTKVTRQGSSLGKSSPSALRNLRPVSVVFYYV